MASAAGRTDMDGDSQMHSSSSESDMFPEEAVPTTPQQFGSHLQSATLSPPGSQEPAQFPRADVVMDTGENSTTTMATKTAGGQNVSSPEAKVPDQNTPGWAWKNPKAREEYERSFAHILDKEFNLREFGELIDERDIVKNTGLKM